MENEMTYENIMKAIEDQTKSINDAMEALRNQRGGFDLRSKELEIRLAELEKLLRPRRVSLPGVELEKEKFSFLKAINAIKFNDWSEAGFEKEVFDNSRAKAMAAGTGSSGGYIVPIQQIAELIELFYANSVVIGMGATVLNDLAAGTIEIPKQTGGATAYWVGENQSISDSDLTLGQLTLSPKAVAALVKLSNRLIKLSNPSAEAMVRRDIATALALKIDLAALRGTGASYQPLGIANTASINTLAIGANGGRFTLDHALDMEGELEDDNALKGNLGFVMHGKVKRLLKKQKVAQFTTDTAGQYIMLPMSDQNLRDNIGYNFATTTQIPTNLAKSGGSNLSEVYFGNWSELMIGQWGGMEIMASSETSDAFSKNQTWVRIIQEVDMGLRHPESFCLCSDAATSA